MRRSITDRVARVHRCRHGDVHAHSVDGDHTRRRRTTTSPTPLRPLTEVLQFHRYPSPLPAAPHHYVRPATRCDRRRRSSILCPSDCWSACAATTGAVARTTLRFSGDNRDGFEASARLDTVFLRSLFGRGPACQRSRCDGLTVAPSARRSYRARAGGEIAPFGPCRRGR